MDQPESQSESAIVEALSPAELSEAWPALSDEERQQGFALLTPEEAEEFLTHLSTRDTAALLRGLPMEERRRWIRALPLDDLADLIQKSPEDEREPMLGMLLEPARTEVAALLAYADDVAGGLMNPRYARLKAEMSVAEAIAYLRAQKRHNAELVYYGYVVDSQNRLLGVVSFRELVTAPPAQKLRDVMTTELITVLDTMDQEQVSYVFAQHDLYCLPVVDADGRMKGIVTADDIVDVVKEEATEDIHKLGGSEALDAPYLSTSLLHMLQKRGGWLAVLFLGETLTASAMAYFEHHIVRSVLTLFVPLIVSSGGNSGSQASTLVIRAMALGEVKLADWGRVLRRELLTGGLLGASLGLIGFLRVVLWEWGYRAAQPGKTLYGDHFVQVGLVVAFSVLGVVLWGTIVGSMLPFVLRRLRLDPASASAPFVATLVDVIGVLVYFTTATLLLGHMLAGPEVQGGSG